MGYNHMKTVNPNASGYSKNCQNGLYHPKNPSKYIGEMPIIYRSSLEYKFCIFCDTDPKVINWSSESLKIPYIHPLESVLKNYYPDYTIKIKKGDEIKEYIVEVKPAEQLIKPVDPGKFASKKSIKNYNIKLRTYIVNLAKKNAMAEFCKLHRTEYIYITENFFN